MQKSYDEFTVISFMSLFSPDKNTPGKSQINNNLLTGIFKPALAKNTFDSGEMSVLGKTYPAGKAIFRQEEGCFVLSRDSGTGNLKVQV